AMVATTDAATFVRIGAGRVTPLMAMVGGQLKLEGDIDAVLRCCELLGLDAGAAPAAQAVSGH
ncbi:transcriptional regulator, partial [Micromonospora chalcea]